MIPLGVRNTAPMLAKPAPGEGAADALARLNKVDGWSYEIKFDGIRCMALVEGGQARLFSRMGGELTAKHPKVVAGLITAYPKQDVMLDGELVCMAKDGTMSFADVARKGSRSVLMVFDVLYDGTDLRHKSYDERMGALDELGHRMLTDSDGQLYRAVTALDGEQLWAEAVKFKMEGVVAKRRSSTYAGGRRSDAWLKIKAKQRVSALVTDLQAGEGSRSATFGALVVSLLDGENWVEVGTVGSGFGERDLAEVVAAITTEKPVIIEVEYLAFTRDGRLREPVFKGIRSDITASECTFSQLPVMVSQPLGRE